MSLSTRAALQAALDRYYSTRGLADVFAEHRDVDVFREPWDETKSL